MKVRPECISCIFERANYECDITLDDESKKIEVLQELLQYATANFRVDAVPALMGTVCSVFLSVIGMPAASSIARMKSLAVVALSMSTRSESICSSSGETITGSLKTSGIDVCAGTSSRTARFV